MIERVNLKKVTDEGETLSSMTCLRANLRQEALSGRTQPHDTDKGDHLSRAAPQNHLTAEDMHALHLELLKAKLDRHQTDTKSPPPSLEPF